MPFRNNPDDGQHPCAELRQVAPNRFALIKPIYYYKAGVADPIEVPATKELGIAGGGTTDIASVPWPLWSLLASHGHQTLPALLHDKLCDDAKAKKDTGDAAGGFADRRDADRLFQIALGEEGVSTLRQYLFWTAVSLHRYWVFRRLLAIVLYAQIAAPYLFAVYAVRCADPAPGATTVAAAAVLTVVAAFFWGSDWGAVLVATVMLPLAGPLFILNGAAAWLIHGLAKGVKCVCGGPEPVIGPTQLDWEP